MTKDSRRELAAKLDAMADGEAVQLGEFGDNAESKDADEHALVLRSFADLLRGEDVYGDVAALMESIKPPSDKAVEVG